MTRTLYIVEKVTAHAGAWFCFVFWREEDRMWVVYVVVAVIAFIFGAISLINLESEK